MWGIERCKKDCHLLVPKLIERRGEYDIFVIDYLDKGDAERTRKFKTLWDDKKLNTQNGTQEVKELLGRAAMSFPKPVALLQDILQMGSDGDDIILDFFAGSGTSGHSVWLENQARNSSRRFILVQIDAQIDAKSASGKSILEAGLDTIDKITCERLRRVSKAMKDEGVKGDLGFRVFKEDSPALARPRVI